MRKPSKKIVIVGAGPGGTAAAMLLAHRGFDVHVYERNDAIGGRTGEGRMGDYRFDLGPTFLMMKFLLDELFEETGRSASDYLTFQRLEPMYDLVFADRRMTVYDDKVRMREAIEACFPGEGEGLQRFLDREQERFRVLYPCLQRDYASLTSYVSVALLKAFPQIALGRSLYDVLSDYFQSEDLRLAFTFQSKYLGMAPWECPGLFGMIPYVEHAYGVFHVHGGLNRIPSALAQVATEAGATFHLSSPVRQVVLDGRAVRGIELESGERVMADEVILNADFGYAMQRLFPPGYLRKYAPKQMEQRSFSCSTFMLYLGVDRLYPAEHHTIIFAEDYRRNLTDIGRHIHTEDDISVYVRNASINDPSLAPEGHSSLYVLAPVSNNRADVNWDEAKSRFRERVLDILERRGGFPDLRSHIVTETMITPWDWDRKQNVHLGATFNMGHSMGQLLYFRPHNKFEEADNCYLVGGGTHPGSGLPTIFESARISSNLICDKYGVPYARPRSYDEIHQDG